MKKLLSITLFFSFLTSTSVFAGSCEIPKFIKKGVILEFNGYSRVVEIDKKSCWIRLEEAKDGYRGYNGWLNLNATQGLTVDSEK